MIRTETCNYNDQCSTSKSVFEKLEFLLNPEKKSPFDASATKDAKTRLLDSPCLSVNIYQFENR
jgi:hypothetical protein